MVDSLDVKLLRKQLGDKRRHSSVKTIYGDRSWINDLDIVNELGGHTGCVNALRWVSIQFPIKDIH
jgi:nuclear receptor interaction protein